MPQMEHPLAFAQDIAAEGDHLTINALVLALYEQVVRHVSPVSKPRAFPGPESRQAPSGRLECAQLAMLCTLSRAQPLINQ